VVYAQPLPKEKSPDNSGAGTAATQTPVKTAEGEMRVRVVDPSGKPVPGAKLEVALCEADQQTPTRSEHTCGPDGIVAIRLPKELPAALSLSVSAERRVPLRVAWANFRHWKEPIPVEFTFTLEKGVPIGGAVHDERGVPIAGARVRLYTASSRSAGGPIGAFMQGISVETDAEGKWRSNVVEKDLKRLRIVLTHRDYLDKSVLEDIQIARLLEPLRQQKAVLVMNRGITVEGTITDPQRAPVASARVVADRWLGESPGRTYSYASSGYYGPRYPSSLKRAWTDRQGHYRLRGLPSGPWGVCVGAPGLAPDMRRVDVERGMAPVDFQLEKGRLLRIRVVDGDGKPVAGASVWARSWRNGAPLQRLAPSETTDEQGEWSWDGAPADELTFAFCKLGYMEVIRSDIQARDEPYVITLPPPLVISGRVVDAETNAPIQQFRLLQTGSMGPGRGSYTYDLTIPDRGGPGTYRVELARGRHTRVIRIEAPGYHPAESRPVETQTGNVTIDFELRKAPAVAGMVRRPNGDPAAGAQVVVCSKSVDMSIVDGKPAFSPPFLSTMTDAGGRFTVQLKDETYTLVVLDERGFAEVAEQQLAASNEITIRPWAQLEGTIEIAGRAAASQNLSLHFYPSVRPAARSIDFFYNTRSDAAGRFTFERVIPGTGYVSCSTEKGTSLAGIEVELASGETTTIQIDWTGVPVADRLELPASADTKALSKSQWAGAVLSRKPLSPPVPRDLRQQDPKVREQLYQEWRESPEGKRSEQYGGQRYGCKIGEDGSFRFDEVRAGVYQLRVTIPIEHEGPAQLTRFAEALQEVTVPETPGRRSGQPSDLGGLKLEFKQTPATIWDNSGGSASGSN
jgi:protocatechuate 3,4-dioxygenase beta subunit